MIAYLLGPEPIEAGVCTDPDQTYKGPSRFRKISGSMCQGGVRKGEKIDKCSQGA